MFTGIIAYKGIFRGYRLGKREMVLESPEAAQRLETGDSLAVDGVCLSVVRKEKSRLFFDLSQETLSRTTLGSLRPGRPLNLEPPLSLSSLVSGHLVSGHIDSVGKVAQVVRKKLGARMTVSFPPALGRYFVAKGSVAVNGVSLTMAGLAASSFEVELVPLTLRDTNLAELRAGDQVNIECDIIGKYIYNYLSNTNK